MSSSRRSFLAAGLSAPALLAAPAAKGDVKLSYRVLGKTGMKVTAVSFGAMITSDGTVLERAADAGINYFDTARGYQNGNCERMVGNALKSRRKNVFISTKSPSRTKAGALADLDTSLRELQTDYVDIWYLHAIGKPEEITDELIEAQDIAKKAGKIRFSGFSTHGGHKGRHPEVGGSEKVRRAAEQLQLHDGSLDGRAGEAGRRFGHGRGGDEGDGGRNAPRRRQAERDPEA